MTQLETVVTRDAFGLVGEAELVQDRVHEVAGAVAGEGPAGAVGSMSSGSKAENEDAGVGVSKAGDWARPVGLILIGAATGFSYAFAVFAEAGTALAGDDALAYLLKSGGY